MAPMGSLIGLAITGFIASGIDAKDQDACMKAMKTIVYIQNIVFTLICVPFLILFKEKPKTPPSKLALIFR